MPSKNNIKKWGQFLSRLNNAGKEIVKIIKTEDEFIQNSDSELVKFNKVIYKARKISAPIIVRRDDKNPYEIVNNCDNMSIFLNNEYVGILTDKGNLLEFKPFSNRTYETNNMEVLPEVLSLYPLENLEKEKSEFNRILSFGKYYIYVKTKTGYDWLVKNTNPVEKVIPLKYFGLFTKSGNLMEFIRFGYRKIENNMDMPSIYNNDYESDDIIDNTSKLIPYETLSPKKMFNQTIQISHSYKYNYIYRKSSSTNYLSDVMGDTILDNFIHNEYNAIIDEHGNLNEYIRFSIRDLRDRLDVSEFAKEVDKKYSDEVEEQENFDIAVRKNGSQIFKNKIGYTNIQHVQKGFIQTMVNGKIEYFAVKTNSGKLVEFIKLKNKNSDRNIKNENLEEPSIYLK